MTALARLSESLRLWLVGALARGVALDGDLLDVRVLLDDLDDLLHQAVRLGLDRRLVEVELDLLVR
jgi:hypothetical protein